MNTLQNITQQLATLRQQMAEYEQQQREASTEFDKLYTFVELYETQKRITQLHNKFERIYRVG